MDKTLHLPEEPFISRTEAIDLLTEMSGYSLFDEGVRNKLKEIAYCIYMETFCQHNWGIQKNSTVNDLIPDDPENTFIPAISEWDEVTTHHNLSKDESDELEESIRDIRLFFAKNLELSI